MSSTNSLILIVDDEPSMTSSIADLLEAYFGNLVQVASFTSGKYALEWLRSHQPVWAILDLVINGVTGFDILKTIRATDPRCQVSIITGCVEESVPITLLRRLMTEDPALEYLSKRTIVGETLLVDRIVTRCAQIIGVPEVEVI